MSDYKEIQDIRETMKQLENANIPRGIMKILEYLIDELENLKPPKKYIYQCLQQGPLNYDLVFSTDVKSDAIKWVNDFPNIRCFHEKLV